MQDKKAEQQGYSKVAERQSGDHRTPTRGQDGSMTSNLLAGTHRTPTRGYPTILNGTCVARSVEYSRVAPCGRPVGNLSPSLNRIAPCGRPVGTLSPSSPEMAPRHSVFWVLPRSMGYVSRIDPCGRPSSLQ